MIVVEPEQFALTSRFTNYIKERSTPAHLFGHTIPRAKLRQRLKSYPYLGMKPQAVFAASRFLEAVSFQTSPELEQIENVLLSLFY